MGNERMQSLLIGKDAPWKQFEHHFLRVEHFLPLCYIENGKIKEDAKLMPYASLRVYDPDFKCEGRELLLPVLHRLDFQHLWEVYKERGVTPEEEVLVIYEPPSGAKALLGKIFPHLRIRVNPGGSMEYSYRAMMNKNQHIDWDEYDERTRTIAEWDPMKGRIL
jgi:hypothetical protein